MLGAEVDRLHAHAARLDLREVEDVVDDLEQRVAGGANRLHIVPLLGRDVGAQQQACHADHPVHRRPDLVAHRGKELGLHARHLLQLLVALGEVGQQLGLGLFRSGRRDAARLQRADNTADQKAERDESQRRQERLPGVGQLGIRDGDSGDVGHREHGSDGELERRVVKAAAARTETPSARWSRTGLRAPSRSAARRWVTPRGASEGLSPRARGSERTRAASGSRSPRCRLASRQPRGCRRRGRTRPRPAGSPSSGRRG